MRPVLPSSSPREPFFPAIRFFPCDPCEFRKFCARALPATRNRKSAPILAAAEHIANATSVPGVRSRQQAYQSCKCDEKRPGRVERARALVPQRIRGATAARSIVSCEPSRPPSARSARALHRLLDGLVGLLGELGVHAADLRHLVHVAVIGALGKAALDLDGLL